MTKYRGYYIDNIYFKSKSDIDEFIKEKTIKNFKWALKRFCKNPTMENSIYASEIANYLHSSCKMTYEEIEKLENEVYQQF